MVLLVKKNGIRRRCILYLLFRLLLRSECLFRVGRRLSYVSAVAVVVAAVLTQRWLRRPAHGACRLAQPIAEAVALTSCLCARRLT